MSQAALGGRLSNEDYRAEAQDAPERLSFWDGEVFARTGGRLRHTTLASNLHGLLFGALREHPRRALTGDQRPRAMDSDRAVYADALVLCAPPVAHPKDAAALTNPTVVFEVLSCSTEAFDRGDRFAHCRSFPSVRAVIFLSQRGPRVERTARGEDGTWGLRNLSGDQKLPLPELGVDLALGDLYQGLDGLPNED